MKIPASIVIPTLNEEKYLPRLLDSLRVISSPMEIIVVDGNSEDDTVKVVENYQAFFNGASSLKLVRAPERGISLQRNLGAAQATHEILIFSDADIVISSPEAYASFISKFSAGKYAAAAPRLVPIEPGVQLKLFYWSAYSTQKFLMFFGRPYFAGSYIITTKDTFNKVGGFDVGIKLAEDVDYSLRAGKVGQCALINIPYPVSGRRIIKYGYAWLFSEIPNIFRLLFTGRLVPETIYYPFGEFGGHTAHHVAGSRWKS